MNSPRCPIAVILAAGLGVRLRPYTNDVPKALTPIAGEPLLKRILNQLARAGIKEAHIVTGYAAREIDAFIMASPWMLDVHLIHNQEYANSNNIRSISAARDVFAKSDILLIECDVIVSDCALDALLATSAPNAMLVSPYTPYMDGAVVATDPNGRILRRFIPDRLKQNRSCLKTININLLSKDFSIKCLLPLVDAVKDRGRQLYYDDLFGIAIDLNLASFDAVVAPRDSWFEVDNIADKKMADDLFAAHNGQRTLQGRHGGLWKFPSYQDSCLLVNPYFPPPTFVTELLDMASELVRGYPSGQLDQTILAERAFGITASRLAVGNGASEIISTLVQVLKGPVAMLAPSFEEYYNRLHPDQLILTEEDGLLRSDRVPRLLARALENGAKAIVIVNPNNPTGDVIEHEELLSLIDEARAAGLKIIVDESFIDFADPNEQRSLLDPVILDRYDNLVIIKSISKSYGIPGVRLGLLAASPEVAASIRKCLTIWNVSSFAERTLELLPKYRSEFEFSLTLCREQRARLMQTLSSIPFLIPKPSAANFIFCEVKPPHTAGWLTEILIRDYRILVKDCTGKRGIGPRQYVRFAVGSAEQVDRLSHALKACALLASAEETA